MKNKKKLSIFFKTQIYLILFSIIILLLLWLFEIIFFKIYYKVNQEKNVSSVVELINKNNTNEDKIKDEIENIAYQDELCIAIYSDYGQVREYNSKAPSCSLRDKNVRRKIFEFINSNNKQYSTKIKLDSGKEGYLYSIKNDVNDIFIYTSLDNNVISDIIHHEFIYIIFITIILSSGVAIYISSLITKPIRDITKNAKNIGKENYHNNFKETGLVEIDELNVTLDNVQKELGKVEKYQQDLLANITHDLKTPLTMIKAYAEKIKDISYKDKKKLDNDLEVIIDETDRLTLLVNDILDLSKISNNDLVIEEYNLSTEIDKIIKKYEIIKDMENYNFTINIPKNVIVWADKNKINQVIYNLINNAINYTGDDKKVDIKVSKKDKGYLIEIKDTGKGIEEKDINNIWTKYYKNDKNHKRNVISSGIGLSIVKEILEKHHFRYGVKSKIGKGSTFYFIISSDKNHIKNTNKN